MNVCGSYMRADWESGSGERQVRFAMRPVWSSIEIDDALQQNTFKNGTILGFTSDTAFPPWRGMKIVVGLAGVI